MMTIGVTTVIETNSKHKTTNNHYSFVSCRPLDQDGSYVITGGLGALGLIFAGWLLERKERSVRRCCRRRRCRRRRGCCCCCSLSLLLLLLLSLLSFNLGVDMCKILQDITAVWLQTRLAYP